MDTLASRISHQTLDQIVSELQLDEVTGENGGPLLPLVAEKFGNLKAGSLRLWDGGEHLLKLVYTGITVEPIGIDSHMLFAFTPPASAVPTFTLDSVYSRLPPGQDPNFAEGGDMYAFHLDLVPRCDLGINLAYIKRAFEPLTEAQAAVLDSAGVYPAQLSPTQRAIMSPWMLAQRTTTAAYESAVFPAVDAYTTHWLSLVRDGMDDLSANLQGDWGASRDLANRELIFHRDIDPVWGKIDMLVGPETADFMIGLLRSQVVEAGG